MIKRLVMTSIAISSAIVGLPVSAETLPQLIDKLPPPQIRSQKSLPALEYCIGVGMAKFWTVSTLDGEGKVLIYTGPNYVGAIQLVWLIQITEAGDHRAISFSSRHDRDHDKLEAIVQSCI